MKRPNRFLLFILRFLKHKIYLPMQRLRQNIILTFDINRTIHILRKCGLNTAQINYQLREPLEEVGISQYDGTFIFFMPPLFGGPHNQFES